MKRDASYKSFLAAYPPTPGQARPVDGVSLAEAIEEAGEEWIVVIPRIARALLDEGL